MRLVKDRGSTVTTVDYMVCVIGFLTTRNSRHNGAFSTSALHGAMKKLPVSLSPYADAATVESHDRSFHIPVYGASGLSSQLRPSNCSTRKD
jgi:hypothetical protein